MPLLTSEVAKVYSMHDVSFTAVANSTSGAKQLAGWTAEFAPHTPGQEHRMSAEELLFVVRGSLDVELDGSEFTAAAGDAVLIPAGAAFRVSNAADTAALAWVVTTLGMTATMAADEAVISPPWAQ